MFELDPYRTRESRGGLDAYLTREPDTRDEHDPQRDAAAAREQRWADFIAYVKNARPACLLRHIADLMEDRGDWHYEQLGVYDHLKGFADTEGWEGVLSAVARAMKEQAAEAAEIERRR